MNYRKKLFVIGALLALSVSGFAQDEQDGDELKLAALHALMTAPPERAMPLLRKVLAGDNSEQVKENALFVLSQVQSPEAADLLLEIAREDDNTLRTEAIRMIGIGGNSEALVELASLYENGDEDARAAVLEAYLIAGDVDAVFNIAVNTEDPERFSEAVEILSAMGAREQLRQLRGRAGAEDALIEAFAIAGDIESLLELARDGSDTERQTKAIEAMGIVGSKRVGEELVEIYRAATTQEIRDAALEGMLIAGHDDGLLELYRAADSKAEKQKLLEMMAVMGSDDIWEVIDAALEGGA